MGLRARLTDAASTAAWPAYLCIPVGAKDFSCKPCQVCSDAATNRGGRCHPVTIRQTAIHGWRTLNHE
ncbi:hypothetical protein ACS15_3754 [Ralstonia insidiosa]|uniref:Uncharacterized protein n=1 Tax=Ralstonia insidiosa TaxID=190721 RepID=A0AAC9BF78_9RALS|nr:hypothetical protein ACS15_3754 [Ralstonia insidiosa]